MTRPDELDARGRRLRAALAAVLVRDRARELDLVHRWLYTWAGLGLVVAGMTHQGWDVQLTACAARDWRANFFPVGIAHSIVGGSAWERTPSRTVQRAAWEALKWDQAPGADLVAADNNHVSGRRGPRSLCGATIAFVAVVRLGPGRSLADRDYQCALPARYSQKFMLCRHQPPLRAHSACGVNAGEAAG